MPKSSPERSNARAACFLCGGGDWRFVVVGYDRRVARDGDYRYFRCAGCGLVGLGPLPAEEEIKAFYPDDYPAHRPSDERRRHEKAVNRIAIRHFYATTSVGGPALVRGVFRLLSGRILREIHEPIGANRLLDLGCGSGALLDRYRDLGWSVFGIDPSPRAVAVCRARGLDVHEGTLFDAPVGHRQFDLVVMSHTIEHVSDPLALLRRAGEILSPAGRILVTTPNAGSPGLRAYGSCWFSLDAPRHLHLFDPRALRLLAAKAGLAVARLETRADPEVHVESRHYLRTQGRELAASLEERRAVIEASLRARKQRPRVGRLLSVPLAIFALAGRGDILEVELARSATA